MLTLSGDKCVCGATSAGGAPCGKCSGALLGVGRILMALIFVVGAYGFVMGFSGQVEKFEKMDFVIGIFNSLPALLMGVVGVVLKVGGGLGMLLGFKTRLAALALIVYVFLATLMYHVSGDGFIATITDSAFLKNLAVIGGLLYIYVAGAGDWSLDNKKSLAPQA